MSRTVDLHESLACTYTLQFRIANENNTNPNALVGNYGGGVSKKKTREYIIFIWNCWKSDVDGFAQDVQLFRSGLTILFSHIFCSSKCRQRKCGKASGTYLQLVFAQLFIRTAHRDKLRYNLWSKFGRLIHEQ